MVEDGYAEMLAAGHAPSHVRKVHAILSSALAEQVRRGHLDRSPCDLVEPPKLAEPEKVALTQAQARRVLAAITGRPNAARWAVGLACGLRQGEALGLRWQYVDLDAGEARIWHQLQRLTWRHGCQDPSRCGKRGADCPRRHGGGLVFRVTKERRRKTVPLAPEVVTLLRSHRATQAQDRLLAGSMWEDLDLVFCQKTGGKIDPRADWEEWKGILKAAGIPHVGVHGARHTMATLALGEGVGLAVAQELLGHSDIRVTRGYTHVSSPLARDAAARVGRALFGPANSEC
jgi:integrase